MDTTILIAIVAVIIILIVVYLRFFSGKEGAGIGSAWTAGTGGSIDPDAKKPGTWTVYGSDNCGWTLKQLAVFDSKGIPYNYVNCDKGDCSGTTAFPTLVDPNGVKTVGFNGLE